MDSAGERLFFISPQNSLSRSREAFKLHTTEDGEQRGDEGIRSAVSLRGTRRETCLQPRLLSPVPQSQNVYGSVRAKGLMGPERGKRPRGLKAGRRGGEMRVKRSHRNL